MTSYYALDIYYRWRTLDDGVWSKWMLYNNKVLPFTEVGRYTIEGRCDYEDGYDSLSVTFEVDRSQAGLLGDVNMDGTVNVADVTSLIAYILGNAPAPFNEKMANVDGEGQINVADVTALINYVLNPSRK